MGKQVRGVGRLSGMEGILAVVDNAARFVAILGGALAAVFVAYTGILWMTSGGEPQRVAQARGALIGVVVGLILVGMAFLVPKIVSETIIEPAGGFRVSAHYQSGCDQHLRRHLVATRAAGNKATIEAVIDEVQTRYSECGVDVWNPIPVVEGGSNAVTQAKACAGDWKPAASDVKMGGIPVPELLLDEQGSPAQYRVRDETHRDPFNNILVLWAPSDPPSDDSACWVYYSRFGSWQVGYD